MGDRLEVDAVCLKSSYWLWAIFLRCPCVVDSSSKIQLLTNYPWASPPTLWVWYSRDSGRARKREATRSVRNCVSIAYKKIRLRLWVRFAFKWKRSNYTRASFVGGVVVVLLCFVFLLEGVYFGWLRLKMAMTLACRTSAPIPATTTKELIPYWHPLRYISFGCVTYITCTDSEGDMRYLRW